MDWRDLARTQAGVIQRRQLAAADLSEHQIQRLVASRELRELLPGVYLHRSLRPTSCQRLWAGTLWSDGGVVSHRSAAELWQLPVPAPERVHLTVHDRRYRPTQPSIRLHRVPLRPDEVCRLRGVPATSRVRTIIDLLRTERLSSARSLLDRSIQLDWLSVQCLDTALRDGRRRTGNVQLRRLVAGLEPGAHAESERVLHRLLRAQGIAGWRAQYPVRLPGRLAVLDVAIPEHRLAIEVDGKLAHDVRSDRFEDDRARQNALVAAGWRVLRFTWRQLNDNPAWVADQIMQFLPAENRR